MSTSKQIDRLYDMISEQNGNYITAISIIVAIIVGLFVFIAFVQLRLSQKEVDKIEKELMAKFIPRFSQLSGKIDNVSFSKSEYDVTTVNGWKVVGDKNEPITVYSNDSLVIINLDIKLTNENKLITAGSDFMTDPISNIYGLDGMYSIQGPIINKNVLCRNEKGKWMLGGPIINDVPLGGLYEIKQTWIRKKNK